MSDVTNRGWPCQGLVARVACFLSLALVSAPLTGQGEERYSVRLTNPYSAASVPPDVEFVFSSNSGTVLQTLRGKVENGGIVDLPALTGASRIAVRAAGFDEVKLPISTARISGIQLPPLAKVTVRGLTGGKPAASRIAKAWLRRRGDREISRREGSLDDRGTCSLGVPSGDWEIVFQAPGFAPVTTSTSLDVGEEKQLTAEGSVNGLRVRVLVRNEKGQPLPDARVLWTLAGSPTAEDLGRSRANSTSVAAPLIEVAVSENLPRTAGDGTAVAENIPDLPQAWTTEAEGFRRQRKRLAQDPDKALLELAFVVRPLPDLVIDVRDLTGETTPFQLEVRNRPMFHPVSEAYSPFWKGEIRQGTPRRFTKIREGEYRLDLKDKTGVLQTRAEVSPLDSDWDRAEIVRTMLRAPRTISGRIRSGDAPIPGTLFFPRLQSAWPQPEDMLYPLDRLAEFAPRSDSDGRFTIVVGGPGRYFVDYAHPELAIRGNAGSVDLTQETQAYLEVQAATAALEVRVVESVSKDPIPGAELRIQTTLSNGDMHQTAVWTDSEGHYSLADIGQTAAVSLTATAKGFGSASQEIHGPQKEPIVLTLRKAGGLRFRVTDPFGIPVAGAEVRRPEAARQLGGVGGVGYARVVARSDSSGIAEVEYPEEGPLGFIVSAKAFQIEVVVTQSPTGAEPSEIGVVLQRIAISSSISLRDRQGRPVRSTALAFAKFGVAVPFGYMIEKANAEGGSAQALLLSDLNGDLMSHQLLAPGQYQVYQYRPPSNTSLAETFLPLGSLQLPPASPVVFVIALESKGETR